MWYDDDDSVQFKVVINQEEQYSIWPADRDSPLGWRDDGTIGPKKDCLAYIDRVWTDMRPLSLRRFMEQAESSANLQGGQRGDGAAVEQ